MKVVNRRRKPIYSHRVWSGYHWQSNVEVKAVAFSVSLYSDDDDVDNDDDDNNGDNSVVTVMTNGNGSDSPHRRRHRDRSVVFARCRWRPRAPSIHRPIHGSSGLRESSPRTAPHRFSHFCSAYESDQDTATYTQTTPFRMQK